MGQDALKSVIIKPAKIPKFRDLGGLFYLRAPAAQIACSYFVRFPCPACPPLAEVDQGITSSTNQFLKTAKTGDFHTKGGYKMKKYAFLLTVLLSLIWILPTYAEMLVIFL